MAVETLKETINATLGLPDQLASWIHIARSGENTVALSAIPKGDSLDTCALSFGVSRYELDVLTQTISGKADQCELAGGIKVKRDNMVTVIFPQVIKSGLLRGTPLAQVQLSTKDALLMLDEIKKEMSQPCYDAPARSDRLQVPAKIRIPEGMACTVKVERWPGWENGMYAYPDYKWFEIAEVTFKPIICPEWIFVRTGIYTIELAGFHRLVDGTLESLDLLYDQHKICVGDPFTINFPEKACGGFSYGSHNLTISLERPDFELMVAHLDVELAPEEEYYRGHPYRDH